MTLFDELDSLSYEDLVSVCHGIFALWDHYDGIACRLEDNLSAIAQSFTKNHSYSQSGDSLLNYVNERTMHALPLDSQIAGESFLEKIKYKH